MKSDYARKSFQQRQHVLMKFGIAHFIQNRTVGLGYSRKVFNVENTKRDRNGVFCNRVAIYKEVDIKVLRDKRQKAGIVVRDPGPAWRQRCKHCNAFARCQSMDGSLDSRLT